MFLNNILIELVSKNFRRTSPKSVHCNETCFKVSGSLMETHTERVPLLSKETSGSSLNGQYADGLEQSLLFFLQPWRKIIS